MQVTINVNDPVLLNVINKMVGRSNVGIDKYNTTLKEDKSGLMFFLKQIQTELMDATLYLQRLKEEISTLREEKALLKELNDIDVIDAFEVRVKKKKSSKPGNGRGDHYSFTIDEPKYQRTLSLTAKDHFNFLHPEDND
jgi:uncharacterized membrane protein YgaE (UPF0421/DUF939 family)